MTAIANQPTLDVIIVNWNAGEQLRECLESLEASDRDEFVLEKILVVDNASTDNSLDRLDELDILLQIIQNDENRGFAAACNQGAAAGGAQYLLFLNPDTRVQPDTLLRSISFMEQPEHANVGLLGVQLTDSDGEVARTCARAPRLRHFLSPLLALDAVAPRLFPGLIQSEWDHADSREVEHVMGAYFLTRRKVFEALGGFDERFFVYLEDLDYAARVREAGHEIFFLADTSVYHRGGGTSEQAKAERLAYTMQSRVEYGRKHLGIARTALMTTALFAVGLPARLVRASIRRSRQEGIEVLRAYLIVAGYLAKRRTP